MLARYKFVTAKCHLKMERQLLSYCYSNQFAATTVCNRCHSAQIGPPLSQLSLGWRRIISSPFLKLESSKSWPAASLVSGNSKTSKTSRNIFEFCGWKSARYAHTAWVCRGGREDVYTGEDKKPGI